MELSWGVFPDLQKIFIHRTWGNYHWSRHFHWTHAKLVKVLAQLSTKRALLVCKLKEIKLISNLSHRHITQRADIHTWLFGEFSRVFAPSASRDLCWANSPQSTIDLRRHHCRLRSWDEGLVWTCGITRDWLFSCLSTIIFQCIYQCIKFNIIFCWTRSQASELR